MNDALTIIAKCWRRAAQIPSRTHSDGTFSWPHSGQRGEGNPSSEYPHITHFPFGPVGGGSSPSSKLKQSEVKSRNGMQKNTENA
jgi:hypothetical protein